MTGCDLSAITKPWEVQSKVGTIRIKQNSEFNVCSSVYLLYLQSNLDIMQHRRNLTCFLKEAKLPYESFQFRPKPNLALRYTMYFRLKAIWTLNADSCITPNQIKI